MALEDPFEFLISSNESFIDLTEEDIKLFRRVHIKDSIIDFYPYAEVYVRDLYSLFTEHSFFVEGLEFFIELGKEEEGYLSHDYVWSESQFIDTRLGDFLAGTTVLILLSKHYMNDVPQSRSFKDTVSNIVKEIVSGDYGLDSVDYNDYISPTTASLIKYQGNITNSEFIQRLADNTVSSNAPTSPIYTFINAAGEFYFMSVKEMLEKNPVATYRLVFNQDVRADLEAIQDYDIMHGGLPVNMENYKPKVYKLDEIGEWQSEELDIEDYVTKQGGEKLPIRKVYRQDVVSDHVNLGIVEDEDEEESQGYVNSLFKDTSLSYRMEITVHYNKDLLAGKTIELEIASSDEDKDSNIEFGGKWLIIECTRHINRHINRQGIPFCRLVLGKSAIKMSRDSKFYKDY